MSFEIEKLIKCVTDPSEEEKFPYDNLAYQALVLLVRSWPKQDLHCHVSPSLSPEWVVQVTRKNWSLYQDEFKNRLCNKEWGEWREKNKNSVIIEVIKAFCEDKKDEEIGDLFYKYEKLTDAFDLTIIFASQNNIEFLLNAVRYVVRNYFDDGVKFVELRINPCKDLNGIRYDPCDILRDFTKTVQNEESRANSLYGSKHLVNFVLSFNQANYPDKKNWFVKASREILDQKLKNNSDWLSRVYGIDLSGMEQECTKRTLWDELIDCSRDACDKGLDWSLVSHVGDRWNIDDEYNEDSMKHLDFVEDALSIDCLKRIGHGNILDPKFNITRPDKSCVTRSYNNITDEQREKIESILDIIKKKNLVLECVPKHELCFINRMKSHPFYHWKKRGISLSVGIDGTSYIPATLSEWIVWLLLSSPEEETDHDAIVTVSDMQKIVLLNQ